MGGIYFAALLYSLIGYSSVQGQTSNQGLYVLNFMNISTDRTVNVLQVLDIISLQETKVRLQIPVADMDLYIDLDASNDYTYHQTFDKDLGVPRGESVTQSGALLITDRGTNIWAHANKMEIGTTAAYLALPVTQNATEFFVPSYETNTEFHTGFSVAALQDGTCVEIYKVNGDDYTRIALVHLDALDVYTALENAPSGIDYTGVFVNSTRPMAVFGGHECARIPVGVLFCDAVVEQIPPVIEWGTEFIIGPIAGRSETAAGYEFRVIASDNDTDVTYTIMDDPRGTIVKKIQRGQFASDIAPLTTSNAYVECSIRCLVVQYNRGKQVVPGEAQDTDPYMVLIPPIDHYDRDFRFVTHQHFAGAVVSDSNDYMTIVAPTASVGGLRLDSSTILGVTWTPVVNRAEYSTTTIPLTVGYHSLTHTDPNPGILYTGWVYGHGTSNTAYGYVAAYKIKDVSVIGGDIYNLVEPTTQEPVTTQEPWSLGNWTDDFSSSELPQYGVRYAGNFSVLNRKQKVIEKVCSEGYRDFYMNKRLTSMAAHMTAQITNICSDLDGSTVIFTAKDYDMFYTEYTRGFFSFIGAIIGSPTTTFRKVQECSVEMKKYINVLSNWPPVESQVPGRDIQANNPTDASNFLQRDGPRMTACDAVELGILSKDKEFRIVIEAWICNGLDPEHILRAIAGASSVMCATVSQLLALGFLVGIWFVR